MRHSNFMILAQTDDHSEAYKLATSWIIDAGLEQKKLADGAKTISIRSLEYPDHYLRIMNGFSVVLQKFDSADSNFTKDSTFIVKKGLVDSNLYSFELLA